MAGITVEERHHRAELRHEMAMMKLDEARVAHTLKMFEHLPEFAQDDDEQDWIIASDGDRKIYTPQELDNQIVQARRHGRQPAGRNILQTMQDFIIGKSASISAIEEDPEVQEYWDSWAEDNHFDMKAKEIITRTIRDGESFLRWFPAANDGHLQMRFVDPRQIKSSASGKPTYGIDVDPDDYEAIIGYHRAYTRAPDNTLRNETIPAQEMDHLKIVVDSDVKRGVSFFIGIGRYMTDYNKWIQDRIKLNRIRNVWNIVAEPLSGAQPISDLKAKMPDVTNAALTGKDRKKQATRSGSVLFSKGIKWDLKSLNIRANDTKEDGRLIQLMIALGTNFPEYITRADASNANYASSMVAESPFVRAMESWQDFFEKAFQAIYKRVILDGIARSKLKPKYERTVFEWDPVKLEDKETKEKVETSTKCVVNFATLIHRDIKEETEAVQIHIGEGMCSRKTAAERFGYDYAEEQEQIARENAKMEAEAKRRQELFGGVTDGDGNEPTEQDEE